LYTPFTTVLVGIILPCRNDPLLEEVVVRFLRELRGRYDVVIKPVRNTVNFIPFKIIGYLPPEFFDTVKTNDALDIFHPSQCG
jgi:hypothetical protein